MCIEDDLDFFSLKSEELSSYALVSVGHIRSTQKVACTHKAALQNFASFQQETVLKMKNIPN